MSDSKTEPSGDRLLAPPLERLKLVTAYMGLCAAGTGIASVFAIIRILFPQLGLSSSLDPDPGNPIVEFVLLTMLTFGFSRTYFLLRRRQRSGAMSAGILFAPPLAAWLWSGQFQWSLLIPALGLVLLGTAWRHLEP